MAGEWTPAILATDSYDCEWPGCVREADGGPYCHYHAALAAPKPESFWGRPRESKQPREEHEMSTTAHAHAGAVAAQLPRHEAARAREEWPFETGLVYLRDLIVDWTYQRPPDEPFIKRGAADFDPTLVGTIDVNARDDGTFAILDGQQRVGMMRDAAVNKTACYCSIYHDLTIEDEAGFFFRKNKDRKTMLPFYAFRARAVAGDPEANAIQTAVSNLGYRLDAKTNDTDAIGAIRGVESAWRMSASHRPESLTQALLTIRASGIPGSGRKGAFDQTVIVSLARFWQTYTDEEADRQMLAELLAEVGPTNFIGLVRERQVGSPSGVSQSWTGARVLAEHYNRKGRSQGRRVDAKLLSPQKKGGQG